MFCIHYTFNAYRALLVYSPILVRHKLVKMYTIQKYIQVYLVSKQLLFVVLWNFMHLPASLSSRNTELLDQKVLWLNQMTEYYPWYCIVSLLCYIIDFMLHNQFDNIYMIIVNKDIT